MSKERKTNQLSGWLVEVKCVNCGKIFYIENKELYTYTLNKTGKRRYCCSWTCYRQAQSKRKEYIQHD